MFMDGATLFVLAVLFLAFITIFAGVKSVPQGREWTVERFGRFTRVLKPGLNLIVPYFDRIGRKLSVMEEVLPIPSQVVITRDKGEFLTRVEIANFLRAAQSRIGLPYVWGAAGPASFDCSGLVQWAFAQAGVRMPRVSEEQWFTGPHIAYSEARPGDLLFWHYDRTDPTDIDHVAIYAGNGMMIVAPTPVHT